MLEVVLIFLFTPIAAGISIYSFYVYFKRRARYKQEIEEERLKKEQERIEAEQKVIQARELREEQERKKKEKQEEYISAQRETFGSELKTIPRVPVSFVDVTKIEKHSIEDIRDISFSNITKRTNIERLFPFVVIDVETTGLHHEKNEILEVSALKYESCFEPDCCFTTLCNPNCSIPLSATKINHITDEMVSDAPYFHQISDSLSDFISGCNLVGHNLFFDLKFLCANGIDFSEKRRYFDTLELAKTVFNRGEFPNYRYDMSMEVYSFKLDVLCDYINVFREDAHCSLSDCLATGKLFKEIVSRKTSD